MSTFIEHYPLFSAGAVVVILFVLALLTHWLFVQHVPRNCVGIVEKRRSPRGNLPQGRSIALNGEAGIQPEVLREGMYFGFWRWQYRVHLAPLVTVPRGQVAYVVAREGAELNRAGGETLARVIECGHFQDARAFLLGGAGGQRGLQQESLGEGTYALNLALFSVITEGRLFCLDGDPLELAILRDWHRELRRADAFSLLSARDRFLAAVAKSRTRPLRHSYAPTFDSLRRTFVSEALGLGFVPPRRSGPASGYGHAT